MVTQRFPCQRDGRIEHKTWEVDLACAAEVHPSRKLDAKRLESEVLQMATHFPRWVLTVAVKGALVRCKSCWNLLVFDRGVRCVGCGKTLTPKQLNGRANGITLAWFGLMPPIGIDGLKKLKTRLVAEPPQKHVVGHRGDLGNYLLVPLVATYPRDFPNKQVEIFYLPEFFQIHGIPSSGASHTYHMLHNNQMCLFAGGQWKKSMTCREVLQQRAYAHVIKFLNYGNGKRNAFAIVS